MRRTWHRRVMGSDEALTAQQIEHFRTLLVEERTAAQARMKERGAEIPATVRQDDNSADYTDDAAALAERERLLNESEFDNELGRVRKESLQQWLKIVGGGLARDSASWDGISEPNLYRSLVVEHSEPYVALLRNGRLDRMINRLDLATRLVARGT